MNKNAAHDWIKQDVLPEPGLKCAGVLIEMGRDRAKVIRISPGAFLNHYNVDSEVAYKQQCMAQNATMVHVQVGYRDPLKSHDAFRSIHEQVTGRDGRVDRYGICLDWSMGYRREDRQGRPKGTGLILDTDDAFRNLCNAAPVAPHFGDFVLGMPAALENTEAALLAGSTAIGNMGQYFSFRLPHWHDDIDITEKTITALSLCAAQPVPILIHSNVDDGFAALFTDLSCALGAVMLERYIVQNLLGCCMGHCYGHTFTEPVSRWAFQRALAQLCIDSGQPPIGTMVYGNTTAYGSLESENYAAMAAYLGIDIAAQSCLPSGHAITPIPVTEAYRIPEIEETVDSCLFANRLISHKTGMAGLYDSAAIEALSGQMLAGAKTFYDRAVHDMENKGIDTSDAMEMLLCIKRLGPRRMEALYGAGAEDLQAPSGRHPVVETPVIGELNRSAEKILQSVTDYQDVIKNAGLSICVATTDVHEYGKILLEQVLQKLGVTIVDGGVSTDPDTLAKLAHESKSDAVALSTYNGVALRFLRELKGELTAIECSASVFIGGKLNQIPDDSNTSLPIDVSADIEEHGATACHCVEDFIEALAHLASTRQIQNQKAPK